MDLAGWFKMAKPLLFVLGCFWLTPWQGREVQGDTKHQEKWLLLANIPDEVTEVSLTPAFSIRLHLLVDAPN
jgi:hypothetical protein